MPDSPFTIERGLITKNIYEVNSDAYKDVREYEISEGTFVGASLRESTTPGASLDLIKPPRRIKPSIAKISIHNIYGLH